MPSNEYAVEYLVRDRLRNSRERTPIFIRRKCTRHVAVRSDVWKAISAPIPGAFFHYFQLNRDLSSGQFL